MAARGKKGKGLEKIFHKWLLSMGFPKNGIRRSVRTKWQQQDFLGCDILACRDGCLWFVQLSTSKSMTKRRRRIEEIEWPPVLFPSQPFLELPKDVRGSSSILVSVVSHERIEHPADRRQFTNHWRISDLRDGEWMEPYAIEFDMKAVEKEKFR